MSAFRSGFSQVRSIQGLLCRIPPQKDFSQSFLITSLLFLFLIKFNHGAGILYSIQPPPPPFFPLPLLTKKKTKKFRKFNSNLAYVLYIHTYITSFIASFLSLSLSLTLSRGPSPSFLSFFFLLPLLAHLLSFSFFIFHFFLLFYSILHQSPSQTISAQSSPAPDTKMRD